MFRSLKLVLWRVLPVGVFDSARCRSGPSSPSSHFSAPTGPICMIKGFILMVAAPVLSIDPSNNPWMYIKPLECAVKDVVAMKIFRVAASQVCSAQGTNTVHSPKAQ